MDFIQLEDIGEIKIRRGRNIKYLSIKMAPGRGIWVNVPYGVSGKQIERFIREKKEWIHENKSEIERYEKETGVPISPGNIIRTKYHTLFIEEIEKVKASYKIKGEEITLFVPKGIKPAILEKIAGNFLLTIYRLESKKVLPSRMKELAGRYGFLYRKLTFRNNISNWGSCSFYNDISLNIKLMKLPDELIDYVILHELCHTVEKNHSSDFWNLMERVCPDYKNRRNELKSYNTRI